ncbi:MAG: HD domain-containing phosphohydrolase [Elusimicrobiota bacterium]
MQIRDFEELLNIGVALSSVHNLDKLLDMILFSAQKLTSADSGSIYLVSDGKLVFKVFRSNTYFKRLGEKRTREIFKSFEMPIAKQSIAEYVATTYQSLNIPNVQNIPEDSEFHYDFTIDKKYDYQTISMLVVPILNYNKEIIGVLQLINSLCDNKIVPFTDEHQKIATSFSSQAAVAIQNTRLTEELKNAHLDTILHFSMASDYRNKETGNHIKRVSHYSKIIARKIGLSAKESEDIFWSAPMHDIGKLGIPDAILQKPEKLTAEERAIMEQHTIIGAMILKDATAEILKKSRIVALTHHEKIDGTGYPLSLKGDEIPIEGKIVALADVYDALSSKRCYKESFPDEQVISIIKEGSGKHFDEKILDVFLANINEIYVIREKYKDNEEDNFCKLFDFKNANIVELLK